MWNEKSEIYYEKSSLCKKGNIKTQFYFIAGRNTNLQEKYTQDREKKAKVSTYCWHIDLQSDS